MLGIECANVWVIRLLLWFIKVKVKVKVDVKVKVKVCSGWGRRGVLGCWYRSQHELVRTATGALGIGINDMRMLVVLMRVIDEVDWCSLRRRSCLPQ